MSGVAFAQLDKSAVLHYLFQGKIKQEYSFIKALFYSRFLSGLCLTKRIGADLGLRSDITGRDLELAIVSRLRGRNTDGG